MAEELSKESNRKEQLKIMEQIAQRSLKLLRETAASHQSVCANG